MAPAAGLLPVSLIKKVIVGIVAAQVNWGGHALTVHFLQVHVLIPVLRVGPSQLFEGAEIN